MAPYSDALGAGAVRVFASMPTRQREKLLRVLDELARFPSQAGDYHEAGTSGRVYEVRLSDELLLTWWVDHAAREVRIVRIEEIE